MRRRSAQRRHMGMSAWAVVVAIAAATVLLWRLTWGHPAVHINGARVRVGRDFTVAGCARALGLRMEPGDLVDVRGQVLAAGAGRPGQAWRGGEVLAPDSTVCPRDQVRLSAGCDTREATVETATLLPGTCIYPDGQPVPASMSLPFVHGLRRQVRGQLSGLSLPPMEARASAVCYRSNDPRRPKRIAFTFDDGPSPHWTPVILSALNARGARATFFVLGQGLRPLGSTVLRAVELGNEVGTHSWRHANFGRLTADEAREDLARCLRVGKEIGLPPVRWFRPPYGRHPTRADAAAAKLGLKTITWDICTFDWARPGTDRICQYVLDGLRDGAVVLMHDGPRAREQTAAAVVRLIPKLQQQGYAVVTVSEARGAVPVFTGEMRLETAGREFRFHPLSPDTKVLVNGRRVPLPCLAVECLGEVLLPVVPVLRALQCQAHHDLASQTVTMSGPGGDELLRLDWPEVETDAGRAPLLVPPILYAGHALVPLSEIRRVAVASAHYDPVSGVVQLQSLGLSAGVGVWNPAPPKAPTAKPPAP